MALTLKNPRVEALVNEVVEITGETKTRAIERALEERKNRLRLGVTPTTRAERLDRLLKEEIWPRVPKKERGRRLTREEEDALLGYGEHGV